MKLAFYALLGTFIIFSGGMANEPDLAKRRLPTLAIKAAIDQADDFIEEKKIDIKGKFLTRVQYHEVGPWTKPNQMQKTSGPYWQITYEPDIWADGGQVFILIYMDGEARYVGGL